MNDDRQCEKPDAISVQGVCSASRRLAIRPLLAAVALLATLIAAPAAGQSVPEHRDPPVIRAGDLVRITVWRKPELSGELHVGEDGSLRHPLYREVKVAGSTPAEAAARLESFLTQYEANPQLVVEPLLRVAVVGEVRQPNLYSLAPEVTLAEAIALAGGPTERGRLDRVTIFRAGQAHTVDLAGTDTTWANAPVRSGDRIVLERRREVLRDFIGPLASVAAVLVSIANLAF